jgi:hypothetical protein
VCSILSKEPFNLSFPQIADLTDYQINDVLFAPPPGQHREDPNAEHMTLDEAMLRARAHVGLFGDSDTAIKNHG